MADKNITENPKTEDAVKIAETNVQTDEKTEPSDIGFYGDDEVKVKLDKKTKAVFFAVFLLIICITIIGGLIIAPKTKKTEKKQFEMPTVSSTDTVSQSMAPAPSSQLPLITVPSEPITSAVTSALPATSAASVTPPAVKPAQTAPSASTEPEITRFNIDTSEFNRLAKTLYGLGFVYNSEQNMFYSQNDPWQRNMGYSILYDDLSVIADMYFDTVRFNFKYGDKKWLYQIWKGRYGATSGCEMGVYYQDRRTDNKRYYSVPSDSDPLPGMYFELYRYEDLMFKNGPAKHWWLTGFRLLDSSESDALRMNCKFYMPNTEMCNAFEEAVKEQCNLNSKLKYTREKDTITIDWAY